MTASDDRRLVLHDLRSPTSSSSPVAQLTGHTSWVLSTSISQDSRLAISGSSDKTIRLWDIGMRRSVAIVKEQGEVWSVDWTSGSAQGFVSGGEEGVVRWYRGAGLGDAMVE